MLQRTKEVVATVRRPVPTIAALALLMLCQGIAAAEGLYWESTMSGMGREWSSQNYAMPKMMKIVNSESKVVILRTDQEKIIMLNAKRKTYEEMTFAQLEATASTLQKQWAGAHEMMEKRMKELSPEQRAMMEKLMAKNTGGNQEAPSPVTVKSTGETKSIAGHKCTKSVATQDGKTVLTAWTAKDVPGFDALRTDWLTLQKRLASLAGPLGGSLSEAYSKIDGFPLETDTNDVKMVVTKVEARTAPSSEFEVPAGYSREVGGLPNTNP